MRNKVIINLSAILLTISMLAGCGGGSTGGSSAASSSAASSGSENRFGILSYLNMSEKEASTMMNARKPAIDYLKDKGVLTISAPYQSSTTMFYDTLDAIVMALEAGEITATELPKCTADYICAHNDRLTSLLSYNLNKAEDFDKALINRMGVGFSFLMKEDRKALCDEFDKALTEMKKDGTLNTLIKNYIRDGIFTEFKPVEFTKTGGETIKIAVTGSLPPMDYVAPDGTFAGFNTAICAELGKRLGKNIEFVQVDSMGRAAALSSGRVDVVFWTCGSSEEYSGGRKTEAEQKKYLEDIRKKLTPEQINLMKSISGGIEYVKSENKDRPDGTLITQPYYSDLSIIVGKK